MPNSTLPISSVRLLQDVVHHAEPRAQARLSQIQALFATDIELIEAQLERTTFDGLAPATQAAAHLLAGGKRLRPITVLLSAACFAPVTDVARELAIIAELVHLATLLHDDVLDDCQIRRGKPAARCLWGNAVSVLAGDLLLTHALERAAGPELPVVLPSLLATLRRLVDGEVLQLRGRSSLDLRQETYFSIVRAKTASLFEWAARAGAMASHAAAEHTHALAEFGRHLGTAFQLIDDALDYCGDLEQTGKAIFADLEEGKVTLPLIYALQREPSLAADLDALRAGDHACASRIAAAVLSLDACAPVRALARVETAQALRALEQLPVSEARELLCVVARELTERVV